MFRLKVPKLLQIQIIMVCLHAHACFCCWSACLHLLTVAVACCHVPCVSCVSIVCLVCMSPGGLVCLLVDGCCLPKTKTEMLQSITPRDPPADEPRKRSHGVIDCICIICFCVRPTSLSIWDGGGGWVGNVLPGVLAYSGWLLGCVSKSFAGKEVQTARCAELSSWRAGSGRR